jgi:hypothetical protein
VVHCERPAKDTYRTRSEPLTGLRIRAVHV